MSISAAGCVSVVRWHCGVALHHAYPDVRVSCCLRFDHWLGDQISAVDREHLDVEFRSGGERHRGYEYPCVDIGRIELGACDRIESIHRIDHHAQRLPPLRLRPRPRLCLEECADLISPRLLSLLVELALVLCGGRAVLL